MNVHRFMVNFTMPPELPDHFLELLPYQEVMVDRYLLEGKLVNYALSLEEGKLWAVFNANSELEVLEMIVDFPLTAFMQVEISLLTRYQAPEHGPQGFSLN